MIRFASRALLLIPFVAVISVLVLADPAAPALAGAAFVPTRFDDPAPDGCQPVDCSLREAVIAANTSPGADTITLGAGTYTLSIPGDDTVTGDLNVYSAVTIMGAGAATTVVDGGGIDRVFFVSELGNLSVGRLTVSGGNAADYGGAFLNVGILAITDMVIRDNNAAGGAGIFSGSDTGRLLIDRTTISSNSAGLFAGGLGLADPGSEATITNSTISGNTATDYYTGGVHIYSGANVTLTNVTISANSSPAPAAMTVTSDAVATLTNVTIADNVSTSQFKGAIANYADIIIRNTIIQDTGLGCYGDGTFQSQGHNIGSDGTCNLTGTGDMPSTDPVLGPLADNGGPTETRALLAGSPAIDAGDAAACPFTDQRGYGRAGVCDIGAYEFGGAPVAVKQGDVNCVDAVTAVDALFILRAVAQIPPPAECLDLAGDVNCDNSVTAVDALGVLRYVASLPVNQNEPCPDIGTPL